MVKIAIVGRPNVGKSTLFNRLAGRKLALVDDRPGVTRDRRFGTGRIGDIDLEMIDTAGFEDIEGESLEARMRRQTELALDDADVALFVFDAREGVTPLDQVFAELLRKRGKPVVLVANKAEGKAGDAGALEAFKLGFGEAVAISAEHGEGMSDLFDAIDAARPVADDAEAELGDSPLKIAIVGRPNAGKSTLVNQLIGEERMLTGPEAGITRDAISVDWDWNGRPIRLVDTAGLRRRARITEALEKLSTHDAIRAITFAEVVILVMDATHPFETQDVQIADLVEREGRALVFVLAKWDLIEDPNDRLKACQETAERMLPQLKGTPMIALSAETGRGLDRLMPAVAKAHADWSTKVKTSDLNTWLRLAVERHPPPLAAGRRVKPKYIAQTKARPPTFILFASRGSSMPDSYRRYLINSIRQSFDLPGTPVRLTVRSSDNPYATDKAEARKASRPVPSAARPKSGVTRPRANSSKAAFSKPKAAGSKPGASAKPKGAPLRSKAPRPSTRKTAPSKSAGRGPSRPPGRRS
ncbi:MAG: ribosome biogenesis GTPase Der [Caulobacteraceae bacterium]